MPKYEKKGEGQAEFEYRRPRFTADIGQAVVEQSAPGGVVEMPEAGGGGEAGARSLFRRLLGRIIEQHAAAQPDPAPRLEAQVGEAVVEQRGLDPAQDALLQQRLSRAFMRPRPQMQQTPGAPAPLPFQTDGGQF